jgi:L-2,4-diaminobutyrate decarboxylase
MLVESVRSAFGIPPDDRRVIASVLKTLRAILEPGATHTNGAADVSLENVAGQAMTSVLAEVDAMVRGASVNPRHPGAIAHMVQPPATIAVLGDLLVGALNQCAFVWEQGPLVARVEREVLRWMTRRLALPESAAGMLTSGGTASNMLAFFLARSCRAASGDRNVGLLRAIVSDQAHFSIDKAARLVGFGRQAVVRIPTDAQGRLRPGDVMRTAERVAATGEIPFLFVATAGTSNAGAMEPVEEYLDAARRFGAWAHLDAAFGGLLALSRRGQRECAPWSAADSISWDPHKSLFVPFASGALFVRDPDVLNALEFHSEYALKRGDSEDVGFRHLDGARRFEALKIWMVIRHLGLAGLRDFSDRKLKLAADFVAELRRSGPFDVMTEPDLNVVCFRFAPPGLDASELDSLNLAIKDTLFRSGSVLLSATRLGGRLALRAIFSNPALEHEQLRAIVNTIERCGKDLLAHHALEEFSDASIARYQPTS